MRASPGPASFRQHLNRFAVASVLAGVVLLVVAWPAAAEVVYTPTNITIGPNGTYDLDLNNDGISDFTISINQSPIICGSPHGPFSGLYYTVTGTPASGNGTEGSPPARLKGSKDQIGPAQNFYAATGTMAWVQFCQTPNGGDSWISDPYGNQATGLKGYLGLAFQISGETYYGWALLRVTVKWSKEEVFVTVLAYAYETVPGMPINAGQTQ